ncbi:DUF3016 domain-containing protein [Roseomonas sp. HJA6]|uniref:DUF3016 domain-containing protein n=1 Tax=Roseomonas alba TaxID=2846776 RepID=A0ABS7AAH6_9PROT|nr:DUF3016 domain-containing protein [Neoroseomonas alba]MBW6398777.1 DUF3016 domain-containing protein [Neoroseomonas alba]
MRSLSLFAASTIAGLVAAAPAMAGVDITFVNPRGFTDAGLYRVGRVDENAPALTGLRRIFERSGRGLPPGQDLKIEVLDVDLAGFFPPWRGTRPPIRVMEPTTWPRITLRYTLTQNGRVIGSDDAVLTDMTYLRRPAVARSTDPLRFEEPMIADWFAVRFGVTRRPAAR